jgi:hypothetical protein
MNAKHLFWAGFACACLIILVACSTSDSEEMRVETSNGVPEEVSEAAAAEAEMVADGAEAMVQATAAAPIGTAVANQPAAQQRRIIKDGQMVLTVEDTETAVTKATDLTIQLDGYIISQQVWDDERGYRFATMKVGVPVSRFEGALQAFRELGSVNNESASGEDVTDQYVDLQSRLYNLVATRDRLRTFLEAATSIEEALQINEELKIVEEEIAVIQGRLNFLSDRAAFSTISLTLNPWLPTATPTATPSATPIPTAQAWHPANTAQLAAIELQESAQQKADFGIYYGIVCGPWLLFLGLLGLSSWKIVGWWRKK